jgi:hypothetical protein
MSCIFVQRVDIHELRELERNDQNNQEYEVENQHILEPGFRIAQTKAKILGAMFENKV